MSKSQKNIWSNRFTATTSAVILSSLTIPALAGPASVSDSLGTLDNSWAEAGLDLNVVTSGDNSSITVGDLLSYEIQAEASGTCYFIHVNAEGTASLMKPKGCDGLAAGQTSSFPDAGNLEASAPLGEESIYAFMLADDLPGAETLLAGAPYVELNAGVNTDALLEALATASRDGSLAIASSSYTVAGATQVVMAEPEPELQYTTRGIIRKVTKKPEADPIDVIEEKPVSIDVQSINFEFGSEKLTEAGIRQLDEFGAAMKSPDLEGMKLTVAGHTDDQGSDSYNQSLSRRRAEAAAAYLEEKYDIPASRIDTVGYGESRPLINEASLQARRQNRRVEMLFSPVAE